MGYLEFKNKAEKFFVKKDYKQATYYYSLALRSKFDDRESRIGIILSDMAMDSEEEAQALFDYYTVLKNDKTKDADSIMEDIIESFDNNVDEISKVIHEVLESSDDTVKGLTYSDFKYLINNSKDFSSILENILFSTKVVLKSKYELFDFIEELINHNYSDMASTYIEGAAEIYKNDQKLNLLIEKLDKINSENRS